MKINEILKSKGITARGYKKKGKVTIKIADDKLKEVYDIGSNASTNNK